MSYNKNKTIADIWLEAHYPNKTLLTNFSMNLYDFPEYVKNHVMNNWYQNVNSKGRYYWEKHYIVNSIKYNPIKYNLF